LGICYNTVMYKINIVAVGSLKEKFWRDAVAEYIKRLGSWGKINVVEIDEASNLCGLAKLEKEKNDLLKYVKDGKTYLLDIDGKNVTSEQMSNLLTSDSVTNWIIGGSNGVSKQIKDSANDIVSFGKITIPHQLCRVVLVEQIYRGMMISLGRSYHK